MTAENASLREDVVALRKQVETAGNAEGMDVAAAEAPLTEAAKAEVR